MKEKKIDFSKCKPKLHVLYPCWTVFDEKMLQSAVQRSSVRYSPIGRNGFTDALRSPMAHTNICTHMINCHSQCVCTVYSTVRVYTCTVHVVYCTCTLYTALYMYYTAELYNSTTLPLGTRLCIHTPKRVLSP